MIIFTVFLLVASQNTFRTVVFGNTENLGYYFAEIWVGSPSVRQTVILDTGSALTAFPCSGCENCGKHMDTYFNPLKSSTFKYLSCTEGVTCSSCNNGACEYHQSYAEGSSISGVLAEDLFDFSESSFQGISSIFGCHRRETNLFKSQKADGIMGLALKKNKIGSIIDRLYENQRISEDLFALCLGKEDGLLHIGSYDSSLHKGQAGWVKLYDEHFYSIKLRDIALDQKQILIQDQEFSKMYTTGTIIDSGTSFLYLTEGIYAKFVTQFKEFCRNPDHCKAQTVRVFGEPNRCYVYNTVLELSEFFLMFPTIKFELEGSVAVEWKPEFYLFAWPETPNYYCLGVYSNFDGGNILGGIFMRGRDIIFDRGNNRLGFADSDCETGLPKNHSRSVFPYSSDPEDYQPLPVNLMIFSTFGIALLASLCYLLITKNKQVKDPESATS